MTFLSYGRLIKMIIDTSENKRKHENDKLDIGFRILAKIIVRQVVRNETFDKIDEVSYNNKNVKVS